MTLRQAAFWAFLVHLVLMTGVSFSFNRPLSGEQTTVAFLGSILRREELAPRRVYHPEMERVVAPISVTSPDVRRSVWAAALDVVKTSSRLSSPPQEALEAVKFSGPTVVPGSEEENTKKNSRDTVELDLPTPVNVHLRYPQQ